MGNRAPGKLCHGQLINPGKGTIRKFTQKEYPIEPLESSPVGYGNVNTEITVTDANSVLEKVFDVSGLAAQQLAFATVSYPVQISFELPSVLTVLDIVYNSSAGAGADTAAGSGYASGDPFNLTLQASSRSSGSASIVPDLIPTIIPTQAQDVWARNYEFYLANGYSQAQLLTKLTAAAGSAVLGWPMFKPKPLYFSLHGQTASLSANADVHKSVFIGDTSSSNSAIVEEGYSKENGVTIREKEITPTLHAAINLAGQTPTTSQTASVAATAAAGWTGTGVFPSGAAASAPTAITITASVHPTSVAATSITAIPTTGLYLKSISQQPDNETGNIAIVATVVDMSIFA